MRRRFEDLGCLLGRDIYGKALHFGRGSCLESGQISPPPKKKNREAIPPTKKGKEKELMIGLARKKREPPPITTFYYLRAQKGEKLILQLILGKNRFHRGGKSLI